MPIVFAAFVDTLIRLKATGNRRAASTNRAGIIVCLGVSARLLLGYPLANPGRPSWWRNDPRVAAAVRVMDLIPDGTSVAASNWLAPQLTDRDTVTLFQKSTATARPLPDWVLVDVETTKILPDPLAIQQATIARLRTEGYQTAADQDG